MREQKKSSAKFTVINKPRLLITRFSPHAEKLTDELKKADIFSIAQPLLEIEALNDDLTTAKFLSGFYDIIIAVSGNAVECTVKLTNQHWPTTNYFAVGPSTQKLLKNVTRQNAIIPSSRYDSEGLLELDALHLVKNKNILILRGEGGRDFLDKTLVTRGAVVEFLQSYKRIKLDHDGQVLVDKWQQASINGAIISSIEILNQLFSLVPSKHTSWLTALTFYVPSERIAQKASALGVVNVELLPNLSTNSIIDFFKKNNGVRE